MKENGSQSGMPVISKLTVDPSQLLRPPRSDMYIVHLAFEYLDDEADISALLVTTIDPDGRIEKKSIVTAKALVPLGIEGRKGQGRYHATYNSKSKLGVYKYTLQLADSKSNVSEEAFVSLDLLDRGEPRLEIAEVSPSSGKPGDLITLKGIGFDSSSVKANAISIGRAEAKIIEATPNLLVFEVPVVATGPVTVLNARGLTFSHTTFEVAKGPPASARESRMGTVYWSSDEDLLCAQQFGVNPETNEVTTDPVHTGVDTMVVGTTADVIWCSYCPPIYPYCTFSLTSNSPNVLTVQPNTVNTRVGFRARHVTYSAHNVGTATIISNNGSTHTVTVIAEEAPAPSPPGTQPPPPPSPRAPQGSFNPNSHIGRVDGVHEIYLYADWEVFPGAGGADVTVVINHRALQLLTPMPRHINEGITTIELIFQSQDLPSGVPQVDVIISVTATNSNGGASSGIHVTKRVNRIPYLTLNGGTDNEPRLSFGSVERGQSVAREIVLATIDGGAQLFVAIEDSSGQVLSGSGPGGGAWNVQAAPGPTGGTCTVTGCTIDPGESCIFTVEFRPTSPLHIRQHEPRLRFVSAARQGDIGLTLRATGLPAAQLAVHQAPGDQVEFGAVGFGDTKFRDVIIENVGDNSSILRGYVLRGSGSGAFSIAVGGGSYSLAVGERKTITIAYAPQSSGAHTNYLHIHSNDFREPDKRITLKGENVRVRILSRVFIPYPWVRDPLGDCYEGDNRGFWPSFGTPLAQSFTSRLEQIIDFDLGNLREFLNDAEAGFTHKIYCAPLEYYDRGGPPLEFATGQADKRCMRQTVTEHSETWVLVRFTATCPNPLVPGGPDIDLDYKIWVNRYTKAVVFGGAHDGYPAYELYYSINNGAAQVIHQYMPGPSAGLLDLYRMDIVVPTPIFLLYEYNRELEAALDGGAQPAGGIIVTDDD